MKHLLTLVLGLVLTATQAQINGYAQITGITGTTLSVGAFNEASGSFVAGKQVVLMQMQDDVIGGNTGNNVNFGNLSSIREAGRYEVRTIASVTRDVFGAPTDIELDTPPTIPFNFGPNTRVQAITFELLGGGGDFTTTANITALAWNGDVGGVVAFEVQGTLRLAHSITADGAGFRGGARDLTYYTGPPCDGTTYRASSVAATTNRYGSKGEGIYRLTNTAWGDARGKILNGGGGGNMINAGGGGGGNYAEGGSAVFGWSCGSTQAGGLGGISLMGLIGADRLFMGGGGGGGEGNNNVSTDGGRGGGLVLLKADTITTVGPCSPGRRISANGAAAANAGNDGAGGGGGGGSVMIECSVFDIPSNCTLLFAANGGNGGTVNSSTHGGGGGGGQGVVVFSGAVPSSNTTVTTNNGAGGCNNSSNPCNSRANGGVGPNGAGILSDASGPLPIELLSFQAIPVRDRVDLSWTTATEIDNAFFTVERSVDGEVWQNVLHLPGAGTSFQQLHYRASDMAPLPGLSYYRLRQTDLDGTTSVHDRVAVRFLADADALVAFPNPASETVTLVHGELTAPPGVQVIDGVGRVHHLPASGADGRTFLDVRSLAEGTYTVVLSDGRGTRRARIVVGR